MAGGRLLSRSSGVGSPGPVAGGFKGFLVVVSGVIRPLIRVIIMVTLLRHPLITTRAPPSRLMVRGLGLAYLRTALESLKIQALKMLRGSSCRKQSLQSYVHHA